MPITYAKGWYQGEVTQTALGKNEKSTPEFVVKAKVLSRGGLPVDESYERTVHLYMSEAALPHTIDKLRAIGFKGESVRDLMTHDFTGAACDMKCSHERGTNGEDYEKWDFGWGSSAIEVIELNPSEVRGLDAMFASALKSKGTAKPKVAKPSNGPASQLPPDVPPPTDDFR